MSISLVAGVAMSPAQAAAMTPNQTNPSGVLTAVNADINYFWWLTFRNAGWTYRAPVGYVWYDAAGLPTTVSMGGCGETALENSYYCSSDMRIYLDYNWHQSLIRGTGDFASAFVLIHEWSHHIQTIRQGNWMNWATQYKLFAGRELQADCYAGTYARYLAQNGRLASGDLDEALAWLRSYGDRAGLSPYDTQAHGTPSQRQTWFLQGYNSYNLGVCDGVYRAIYWPGASIKAA
jgi:predicted metalloprotease